jgi:8-oxo-dGTP pyrophosphatase MutT (NUDIX family)
VENIMNNFLTAVLIFLVVAMPGIALADGAGVIAYTKIQGETYVLLADHHDSNRGWASFGGRLDGQPTRVAALREFHEETRCVYRGTTVVFEEDRSVKTPRFVAYDLFAGIENLQGCTGPQYQERGPWAWVPASSLRESLARGIQDAAIDKQYLPSGHHGKLWPVDAENLQMAFEQGLIP